MRLVFIFILSGLSANGQDESQRLISTFKVSICDCFQKKHGSYANEYLSIALDQCGFSFLIDNEAHFGNLVNQMPDSLSDFQKGQKLGFEVMSAGASELIKNCQSLSDDLIKFKNEKMKWLMISKENVKEKILSAESRVHEVTDPTKIGSLYYHFGLMYEVAGDYEKAKKAYSKSLEVSPSLITILLLAQITHDTK